MVNGKKLAGEVKRDVKGNIKSVNLNETPAKFAEFLTSADGAKIFDEKARQFQRIK